MVLHKVQAIGKVPEKDKEGLSRAGIMDWRGKDKVEKTKESNLKIKFFYLWHLHNTRK